MATSHLQRPESVPRHLAGKWIAWTPNGRFILGSGDSPKEAREAAQARGSVAGAGWVPWMGVALEWVPPADERFVGSSPL